MILLDIGLVIYNPGLDDAPVLGVAGLADGDVGDDELVLAGDHLADFSVLLVDCYVDELLYGEEGVRGEDVSEEGPTTHDNEFPLEIAEHPEPFHSNQPQLPDLLHLFHQPFTRLAIPPLDNHDLILDRVCLDHGVELLEDFGVVVDDDDGDVLVLDLFYEGL